MSAWLWIRILARQSSQATMSIFVSPIFRRYLIIQGPLCKSVFLIPKVLLRIYSPSQEVFDQLHFLDKILPKDNIFQIFSLIR